MGFGVKKKDFTRPKPKTTPVEEEEVASNQVGWIRDDQTTAGLAITEKDQREADKAKCKDDMACTDQSPQCQTDADCNNGASCGPNHCMANHKCYCAHGMGPYCREEPTYYKDPAHMTERQIMKFKYKAKFDKMTVQDYVNWLRLFEGEEQELSIPHLDNFRKLQKGQVLTVADIPRDRLLPPMNADDYFNKLYNFEDQVNLYTPQNSDMAGLQIPANYSQYATFEPPKSLKHLNVQNLTPDQEVSKLRHKESLTKTRPEISHDWDLSVGTSVDQSGKGYMKKERHAIVKNLGKQISPLDAYPEN